MPAEAVYGAPPPELAVATAGALQLSPLFPGANAIEELADGTMARFIVMAPPGTLERRYVLAQALRTLVPEAELVALAPKTRGGTRLATELEEFGCKVEEHSRRHHRICRTRRPAVLTGLAAAIAGGAPKFSPALGLWTQPGVFSWDRLDPGTNLLLNHLDGLAGRGADLGCGVGVLAHHCLQSASVSELICVDIDRRALDAARRNLRDQHARFVHLDVRRMDPNATDAELAHLDFVIMNPPFHDSGREDRGLGLAFISAAAGILRKGGRCRMVANIALPYQGRLNAEFSSVCLLDRAGGYQVYEGIK